MGFSQSLGNLERHRRMVEKMKKISFFSVMLFCLVTPFIMNYRLSPGETPYWLFGIIFLFLFLSSLSEVFSFSEKIKDILVWALILLVLGSGYFSAILVRHRVAPVYQTHDIILQLEGAVHFFLRGKNPYATTYFGTPLELWHYSDTEVNPALYHFVMMPWYLLFSLPFYFVSVSFFGWWDGRMPLLFLFFFTLFLIWRLMKNYPEKRRIFLALFSFNPATLGYFLEGRSDIFMYAFLFLGFYLLFIKKLSLAGIPLALALATKQSAWPIFPLYLAFLWVKAGRNFQNMIKVILPFLVTSVLVIGPFFIWDPKAFLESTIFYLSGSVSHSYPISGYGWGMVLRQLGIISDPHQNYPFWIWQLIFCLPLLIFLIRGLLKNPTVKNLIFSYGVFTFVFWYFSRYFNNSHLGYLSIVFLTAYFWPYEKFEKD